MRILTGALVALAAAPAHALANWTPPRPVGEPPAAEVQLAGGGQLSIPRAHPDRVVLRRPGRPARSWAVPAPLPTDTPALAVNDRGMAALAWASTDDCDTSGKVPSPCGAEVRLVRWRVGSRPGTGETIIKRPRTFVPDHPQTSLGDARVVVDPRGDVVLAWQELDENDDPVRVGGVFAARGRSPHRVRGLGRVSRLAGLSFTRDGILLDATTAPPMRLITSRVDRVTAGRQSAVSLPGAVEPDGATVVRTRRGDRAVVWTSGAYQHDHVDGWVRYAVPGRAWSRPLSVGRANRDLRVNVALGLRGDIAILTVAGVFEARASLRLRRGTTAAGLGPTQIVGRARYADPRLAVGVHGRVTIGLTAGNPGRVAVTSAAGGEPLPPLQDVKTGPLCQPLALSLNVFRFQCDDGTRISEPLETRRRH